MFSDCRVLHESLNVNYDDIVFESPLFAQQLLAPLGMHLNVEGGKCS